MNDISFRPCYHQEISDVNRCQSRNSSSKCLEMINEVRILYLFFAGYLFWWMNDLRSDSWSCCWACKQRLRFEMKMTVECARRRILLYWKTSRRAEEEAVVAASGASRVRDLLSGLCGVYKKTFRTSSFNKDGRRTLEYPKGRSSVHVYCLVQTIDSLI